MKNTVNITVFIALYNAEKYIEQTINSILNQTYSNFELLIIDDASNDKSVSIVNQFKDNRIRLLQNETNKGICYTRQRGLENANGKYIAIIDADDIAMPNRLEKQFHFLENNSEIVLCGSDAKFINENNIEILHSHTVNCSSDLIKVFLLFANQFINSSVMFRKDIAINVGGYTKSIAEDYDLFVKISKHYQTSNINEKLISYRIHNLSDSRTKKDLYAIAENEILLFQYKDLLIQSEQEYIPYLLFHRKYDQIKNNDIYSFFNHIISSNKKLKLYNELIFNNEISKIWLETVLLNKKCIQTWKFILHPIFKTISLTYKQKRRLFKLMLNPLKL